MDEKVRSVAAPCHLVRPHPAAISGRTDPRGMREKGKRGATVSPFCAPLLYNGEWRSPRSPRYPGNAKAPVETSPVSRGLPIAPELGKKKNPARGLSLGVDTGQAGLSGDDAESPLTDKRGLIGAP